VKCAVDLYETWTTYETNILSQSEARGTHHAEPYKPSNWKTPDEFHSSLLLALNFYRKFIFYHINEYGKAGDGDDQTLDQALLDADEFLEEYMSENKLKATQMSGRAMDKMFTPCEKKFREQLLEERIFIASTEWLQELTYRE
jgi:hypothetical protein